MEIRCPCVNCKCIDLKKPSEVRHHLCQFGFMPNYYVLNMEKRINVPNANAIMANETPSDSEMLVGRSSYILLAMDRICSSNGYCQILEHLFKVVSYKNLRCVTHAFTFLIVKPQRKPLIQDAKIF
ncbi:hypothetical protein P8452_37846 [Trifolium repens]|nr:hypothetical protein P8452_37846 [Trifolium repens]